MLVFDIARFDMLLSEAEEYSLEADSVKRNEQKSLFYRVCRAKNLDEAGEELTTEDYLSLLSMARGIVEGFDSASVKRSDIMAGAWGFKADIKHDRVL